MVDPLSDLLRKPRLTEIVDIGANPIDGDPLYKPMLEKGLCRLTGFEPQPKAFAALNIKKGAQEVYLPYAVGDGKDGVFRTCHGPGMSSMLRPDKYMLSHFPKLEESGRVVTETTLSTRRLDDIAEISAMDYLKIDAQGSELSIFHHGHQRLMQAIAIQTEVSFLRLYHEQPTFGEIDIELRGLGFVPHAFVAINKRMIAPMFDTADPHAAIHQLLEADLIYVRDFTKPDAMSDEQLAQLAMIAHHCYQSHDLAVNCIHHLERRHAIASGGTRAYGDILRKSAASVA